MDGAGTVRHYVDGAQVDTRAYTSDADATVDYLIGRVAAGHFMHATLDEVRVCGRALSAEEVQDLARLRPHFSTTLPGTELLRAHAVAEPTVALGAEELADVRVPAVLVQRGTDRVGIGTASPASQLHVAGDIRAEGHLFAHSSAHAGDIAEPVLGQGLEPGDAVVMDGFSPDGKLQVKKSDAPLSRRVVGVVSRDPSLLLAGLPGDAPLAVSGIVAVKVVGPVQEGDLLASSSVPGHAMRCEPSACGGAVLGKALEAHGPGAAVVRALIALG